MAENYQELIGIHERAITRLDEEIAELQKRKARRQQLLEEAQLRAKGIENCRKCGRLVPSPCHDGDGYYGEGPWDDACKEYFR